MKYISPINSSTGYNILTIPVLRSFSRTTAFYMICILSYLCYSDTCFAAEIVTSNAAAIPSASQKNISIFSMFINADLVVKLVMISLLSLSIYSWTIIFYKWKKMKEIAQNMKNFEEGFREQDILSSLSKYVGSKEENPLAESFIAAMEEFKLSANKRDAHANKSMKFRIISNMESANYRVMERLNRKISVLSTISSSSPFIGLFGTVWGIMNSFQAIAFEKKVTLVTIAPGMSEALLTTALGLVAAIPATIFYNYFINKNNRISDRLDRFIHELVVIISRELDK